MTGLDSTGGRHVPCVELRLGGFSGFRLAIVVDRGRVMRTAVVVMAIGVREGI